MLISRQGYKSKMNEEWRAYRFRNGIALLKELLLLLLLALSRHAYQLTIKQKIDRYPAVCVMFLPAFLRLSLSLSLSTVFTGDLM